MAKTFLKAVKMSETIDKCLLKENSKDKETRTIKAVQMSFLLTLSRWFLTGPVGQNIFQVRQRQSNT